ncbi:hypothetical protein FA95DRAFT_1665181, partial [Auriscalpium vulgare]
LCPNHATVFSFSCLLTFFFVLYEPTHGAGDVQRLVWQSWDVISSIRPAQSPGNTETAAPDNGSPAHDTPAHDGVDWWNVTKPTSPVVDSSSLPLDVWSPLLPHDTGCA